MLGGYGSSLGHTWLEGPYVFKLGFALNTKQFSVKLLFSIKTVMGLFQPVLANLKKVSFAGSRCPRRVNKAIY